MQGNINPSTKGGKGMLREPEGTLEPWKGKEGQPRKKEARGGDHSLQSIGPLSRQVGPEARGIVRDILVASLAFLFRATNLRSLEARKPLGA